MDGLIPRVPPERNVVEAHPRGRSGKDKHKGEGGQEPRASFPLAANAQESAAREEHTAPRSPHEEGLGDRLDVTA